MDSPTDSRDESENGGRALTVEYDADNGWVAVVVVGLLTQEITIGAMQHAREVCEQNDCRRILVDVRAAVVATSFITGYMVAKQFSKVTGLDESYRCAFLYDPSTYPRNRAETMETVTRNWDGVEIRNFERFDEAAEYLKS